MATHTWVDLQISEAELLADLAGVAWDFRSAREFAQLLARECSPAYTNQELVEPLSIAALVMYSRPFMTGVRRRLTDDYLQILTPRQREKHRHLRAYRDKHTAHSVNSFEENIPRANYCVERVKDEGITSISHGGGRVIGLSDEDIQSIVELSTILERAVRANIEEEAARILPIVRAMPLEKVLAGGQKVFRPNSARAARKRI